MHLSPAHRTNDLRLPDGRIFHWYEWGARDGIPVIFCTGAGMSGSLAFGTGSLDELGLRLIVPDRPGLGKSSPHPGRTFDDWMRDIAFFNKQQLSQKPLVVGFSQGAPFALALAGEGMAAAMAVVSGQDDFNYPKTYELLNEQVRGMVAAMRSDPAAFLAEFARVVSGQLILDLVLNGSSPYDTVFYKEQAFLDAYRRCLAEGFSQGPDGYLRDLQLSMTAWPFRLEQITCPVDLWFGELDASATHSPDFGRILSSRIAGSNLHLFKDEGGSILWTRPREILQRLAELVDTP